MTETKHDTARPPESISGSLLGLLRDLQRIDHLIHAQVEVIRHPRAPENQSQGLVVSEEEADELLTRAPGSPRFASAAVEEDSHRSSPVQVANWIRHSFGRPPPASFLDRYAAAGRLL
jgi:hypothetical protein